MLPRPRFRIVIFLAALAIPTFAGAAELSLGDVLTSGTSAGRTESGPLDGTAASRMIQQANEDIAAGRMDRAAEAAALLPERIPLDDPAYVDALWLAVRVAAAGGRSPEAVGAAREYLRFAPAGDHAGPAILVVARGEALAGHWSESADQYIELLDSYGNPADHLEPDAFLGAAEAGVQSRRPADARRALEHLSQFPNPSPGVQASRTFWLLESLLLRDDPDIAVPPPTGDGAPLHHTIALRRALLFEMRGAAYEARPVYAELAWGRQYLSPAERIVLDARMSALDLAP